MVLFVTKLFRVSNLPEFVANYSVASTFAPSVHSDARNNL